MSDTTPAQEEKRRTFPRKYAIVEQGTAWRARLAKMKVDFTNRNLDEIHHDIENKVYAMALDGSTLKVISAYFGVEYSAFKAVYREVWAAGNAELKAIINADQVTYGLESKIPVAKIWIGKTHGGMGDSDKTTDEESEAEDTSELNINITVATAPKAAE